MQYLSMSPPATASRQALDRERLRVLRQFENWLELPMLLLGCGWLLLAWMRFARGLNPMLEALVATIWAVFLIEFGLRFALAPQKGIFFVRNGVASAALVVPAVRILRLKRVVRLLRHGRSGWFTQLVGAKYLHDLGVLVRRLAFIVGFSLLLVFVGAAALHCWASPAEDGGTAHFRDSLSRSGMMLLLSSDWPQNPSGRLIAFLLRGSGFLILGCLVAAFTNYWWVKDTARTSRSEVINVELRAILCELAVLRAEVQASMAAEQKDKLLPDPPPKSGLEFPKSTNLKDV